MAKIDFDHIYRDVPAEQREALRQFRQSHPPKHLSVDGVTWEYLVGGAWAQALLILVGGSRYADTAFGMMTALEPVYRVIVPSYPPVTTIPEILDGLIAILDAEGVTQTHVLSSSFGGIVAQFLVRRHPERVSKLILGNTVGSVEPAYVDRLRKGYRLYGRLPMWVLRTFNRRRFRAILETYPQSQRAFWRAFFDELTLRGTKRALLAMSQCFLDAIERSNLRPDDLGDWPGEILIIESDDDAAFPESMRQEFKALYPQARVHTFHGAGHMPAMTRREEYMQLVKEFLHE